ncbi:unnamed protein product [Diabrotica balteata]|uniref:Major facilitator superfamily (MFS) profile domain-containing protein n=1 Tax=Diabrotica balteata TaxID=107213 RepID=A0A9P0E1L7_DIABA|nr:unnamed protein product [Diabrotica balteata]
MVVVKVEKNKVSQNEQEKTWPQIYAVLISTMVGITNGLFYAWASPFMIQIINDKVNYNITEEQASYFNTINPIFTVLICPFCSKLTDNLGRKKTILLIAVPQIAGWLCAAFAKDVYLFYISRAFAGIADGIFFAALPPYVGEITTPEVRGKWGNCLAGSYYIGEFSINVIGSYFGVVTSSYICLPLPIIFFILFSMIPESPYYLLIKGKEEEAKKSIIYFRGDKNIDQNLNQLKHDVQRQMSESGTWKDLFAIKSNRKALLAASFLRFTQHTSGLCILVSFSQFIFQKSGGNLSNIEKYKCSKNEQEKTWPQIYAILISTMAGITNGQLYAWTSPFMVKIVNDKVNFNITEEEASYFNTINPIFTLLICPFCSKLIDNLGRKKAILLMTVPQIAGWLCTAFAKDVYLFYVSRAFSGIADGIFFTALPPYVGEITTPAVRGKWGNLLAGSYYIGEFLINIIGSYFGVVTSSYICLPLSIIFFILFSMIPESPYFLLIKGKEGKAKQSLIYFRGDKNIDENLNQLKHDVQRQMSESGTWRDLFTVKSNRKALLAAAFLRFTQQTSGFCIFITYTQFIFQKAGGNLSHELSSIIYTGVQVTLNFIVLAFIIHRFGRRGCYMTSTGANGIVLFLMATYFYLNDFTNIDVSSFNWFPVVSTVVFQMFASFGINVIPTLMLSELFSVSIKTKAMVLVVLVFGIVSGLVNYLFYLINEWAGFFAPFYVFAACNILAAIIAYFILPETKGKTLEDIQQSLKNNKIY